MIAEHRDIQRALGRLEAAPAASCSSLMVLEAAASGRSQSMPTTQCEIRQAIASVRDAIAELPALNEVPASRLAFGFVLAADVHLLERSVGVATHSLRALRVP